MANETNQYPEPEQRLRDIVAGDHRYDHDAYLFVFEALEYTQRKFAKSGHVSGRELCNGIQQFAIEKFGMMAKVVLNDWGIRKTDDIGEIVFTLVENELMKKTEHDTREDFKEVFDLDEVFVRNFKFDRPLGLD